MDSLKKTRNMDNEILETIIHFQQSWGYAQGSQIFNSKLNSCKNNPIDRASHLFSSVSAPLSFAGWSETV